MSRNWRCEQSPPYGHTGHRKLSSRVVLRRRVSSPLSEATAGHLPGMQAKAHSWKRRIKRESWSWSILLVKMPPCLSPGSTHNVPNDGKVVPGLKNRCMHDFRGVAVEARCCQNDCGLGQPDIQPVLEQVAGGCRERADCLGVFHSAGDTPVPGQGFLGFLGTAAKGGVVFFSPDQGH